MFGFISQAFADEATPTATTGLMDPSGGIMGFLPLIIIFVIFYFLLIRPQMKKQKEQQAMINAITRGERVVFAGGLIGTISKIEDDNIIEVELTKDVRVKALKSSIIDILEKTKNQTAKKETENKKLSAEEVA